MLGAVLREWHPCLPTFGRRKLKGALGALGVLCFPGPSSLPNPPFWNTLPALPNSQSGCLPLFFQDSTQALPFFGSGFGVLSSPNTFCYSHITHIDQGQVWLPLLAQSHTASVCGKNECVNAYLQRALHMHYFFLSL